METLLFTIGVFIDVLGSIALVVLVWFILCVVVSVSIGFIKWITLVVK